MKHFITLLLLISILNFSFNQSNPVASQASDETIKALFIASNGLKRSNKTITSFNTKLVTSIQKTAKDNKSFKPFFAAAKDVRAITQEFTDYIKGFEKRLSKEAGGIPQSTIDTEAWEQNKPLKYKDQTIPTQFFVNGSAHGQIIREKVRETSSKLIGVVESLASNDDLSLTSSEISSLKSKLSLIAGKRNRENISWVEATFSNVPVAACYPILDKLINDALDSETSILEFFGYKIETGPLRFGTYQLIASSEKDYLIKGETYKAKIFLSPVYNQTKPSISVNGNSLLAKNGVATYEKTHTASGPKSYKASISVKNPVTGNVDNYKRTFKYLVGE